MQLIAVTFQRADQLLEILRLTEIPVHRGKAHIGDLVEARERLHHQFADDGRRKFVLAHAFQPTDNAGNHAVDSLGFDRTLAQRMRKRPLQLFALERLAPPAFLHDNQFAQLYALESGEASAAGRAVAAAANGGIVFTRPAVLDLAVFVSAKRATHERDISDLFVNRKAIAQVKDARTDALLNTGVARVTVLGDRFDDLDDPLADLPKFGRTKAAGCAGR